MTNANATIPRTFVNLEIAEPPMWPAPVDCHSSGEQMFQMMWLPTEAITIVAAQVFEDRSFASWNDAG
jgi:hypothetical protein